MKAIIRMAGLMGLFAGMAPQLFGQVPVGYAPESVALRSPEELDQLVGPIALYPDPLIAEILPAATHPSDLVLADRYISSGSDPNQIDTQPWDPSVRGLARFPAVLQWMDQNLAWTTELGQAFLYQQPDVMNAIQRLRSQALALGNLQSTPQQTVVNDNGVIEIVPANPQEVFLPVYQPSVVYSQPPPQPGYYVTFGAAFPIGVWLNHDFDWRARHIIVWHHDHPRPSDWWYHRPSDRWREVPNNSVTVWQPRQRPGNSDRERESRGWVTASRAPIKPPVEENVREQRRPENDRDRRAPAPAEERRAPEPRSTPVPREQSRALPQPSPVERRENEPRDVESRPRTTPRTGEPQPSRSPSVSTPAPRPSSGALVGVQSAPETRAYSSRGQQSRVGTPAAAPPAARPAPAAAPAPRPAGNTRESGERNRR